jgi:hypothetical protein
MVRYVGKLKSSHTMAGGRQKLDWQGSELRGMLVLAPAEEIS